MQFSASLIFLGTVVTDAVHLLTVSASPCSRKELGQPNCGGQSKSQVVGYKHEVRADNTAEELDTAKAEAAKVYLKYLRNDAMAKAEEAVLKTYPPRWKTRISISEKLAKQYREKAAKALEKHAQLQEDIRRLTAKWSKELAEKDQGESTVDRFMKNFLP
ncbi:hypothetical protein BC835DRAFT_1402501 [Cytidiella melzeri]|nr:hypothetical protein BC835DRAFT_1402501 [Cytidiella melzeri]